MYRGCFGSPSSARLVRGGSYSAARAGRLVHSGSYSAARAAAMLVAPAVGRMPVDERVQSGTETLPATHLRVLLWANRSSDRRPRSRARDCRRRTRPVTPDAPATRSKINSANSPA